MQDETNNIVIYQTQDGQTRIGVKFENETVWLTQQQMADLFQSSRTNIVEHIKHIYEEGELEERATCRNFRQVQLEGQRKVSREIPFYSLDMIISLGYRIKSIIATNGDSVLEGSGSISHKQAVDKALEEYRKYQVQTLSPVEKAYLETIKSLEEKAIGNEK